MVELGSMMMGLCERAKLWLFCGVVLIGYVGEAIEKVCKVNCVQVERMYEMYLGMGNIEHMDVGFEEFLQENGKDICPEHGVITYVEGKVQCSVHVDEDDSDGDGDGDVPYL